VRPHASYLPRVSLFDPAEASEGSIDPLGLAQFATTLADGLVPELSHHPMRQFAARFTCGHRADIGVSRHADQWFGLSPELRAAVLRVAGVGGSPT
jgi:hypothetical protein